MSGIYWLASYPKSGNTWFRSFLTNLQADGDTPAEIDTLGSGIASSRAWLDGVLGFDTGDLDFEETERVRPAVYDWSSRQAAPTYHKIHDAFTHTVDAEPLVGRTGTLGALYILRNPLDVAPSFANHLGKTIDQAIARMGDPECVLAGHRVKLDSQVRQRLLSWSGHVESWVDAAGLNVHVIRYEDMLAQPIDTFTGAVRFLQLPDDSARIEKAIRFSDFKVLAEQEARGGFRERPPETQRFFLSGRAGTWRERLTDAQVARIIADHGAVMQRFGYLDHAGNPI